jgi:hypothetical protein
MAGEEPRLYGLKYNQNQLFWMSTASIWYVVSVVCAISCSSCPLPAFGMSSLM